MFLYIKGLKCNKHAFYLMNFLNVHKMKFILLVYYLYNLVDFETQEAVNQPD